MPNLKILKIPNRGTRSLFFAYCIGFLLINLHQVNPLPIQFAADPISASNQPAPTLPDIGDYEEIHYPQNPREVKRIMQKHMHNLLNDPSYRTVKDIQDGLYGWNFLPKLHIPVRNTRQILVHSLFPLDPKSRARRMEELFLYITNKEPMFDKKKEIQERELKLLSVGITVQCQWEHKLPPPFDDKQCSVTELDLIIRRICFDDIFIGLPICPNDYD